MTDRRGVRTPSGTNEAHREASPADDGYVTRWGDTFYCIRGYDRMQPFFMSVVSSSDHWLFVSSTGGLTAGRINAESALFPYYTDDKITENHVNTGPVSCLFAERDGTTVRWEPFAGFPAESDAVERNLYKNLAGDTLVFEEVNRDLGLTLSYAWRTSDRFGLVRTVRLRNDLDAPCTVRLVDGVRNLLPYGATTALQTGLSNLLDAYKRSEIDPTTGLGVFALSATLTDRAEPSESLMATTVWQTGLDPSATLLSTLQLDAFRRGRPVTPETDVKGRRGAYLVHATLTLAGHAERAWHLVAEVNQDHIGIAALRARLASDRDALAEELEADIRRGGDDLETLVAAADGVQLTAEQPTTAHHRANVLFNIMRGGVFADSGRIDRADFADFVGVRNRTVAAEHAGFLGGLPETLTVADLHARAAVTGSPDLIRLCYEYLPLTFSRRHGDPSRPWNHFSINLKHADGRRRLDYQGNWRDIFQNWEPLAWSYPAYTVNMIARFLNATTADGYNPYRVTRDGIDWEAPQPDSPWANIGYWSDHQIIYLLKLLETCRDFQPATLEGLLDRPLWSHADVPYRIREYTALVKDGTNTIEFDWEAQKKVEARVDAVGADGKLMTTARGEVLHVSLAEKLLVLLLAKLGNLVPDGGIWMNTQRPEWNDANNALVGKGLSVVTAAYLRRYVVFFRQLMSGADASLRLTIEVRTLLDRVTAALAEHAPAIASGFDARSRRAALDSLGGAASDYRLRIYREGFSGETVETAPADIDALLEQSLAWLDRTLTANRREDGLYHAYNVLELDGDGATVGRLYEMLEGQVAVLSSGLLVPDEALALLRSLRSSRLYRADQHSYLLYPDRELAGFLTRNRVPPERVRGIPLVDELARRDDRSVIGRDVEGVYHFNGTFRNAGDLQCALERLGADSALGRLVTRDGSALLELFEETFDHRTFTGRSGTFFAYEGLGSIYWHMVSKLLLAAQENYWRAVTEGAPAVVVSGLAAAYYDVRSGIGFNKSAAVYGAFPTDPYSHTPKGQGAKQPGMTGQVKEEILTRFGELGVRVSAGAIEFRPLLLEPGEFRPEPSVFTCRATDGSVRSLDLPAGSLAFTFCQTPVVMVRSRQPGIEIVYTDGRRVPTERARIEPPEAEHIFHRDGVIDHLVVRVKQTAGGN